MVSSSEDWTNGVAVGSLDLPEDAEPPKPPQDKTIKFEKLKIEEKPEEKEEPEPEPEPELSETVSSSSTSSDKADGNTCRGTFNYRIRFEKEVNGSITRILHLNR